jgi:hypothetical protein
MTHQTLCRIAAVATLLAVLARWRMFFLVVQLGRGGWADLVAVVSLATFALALASAAGLWRGRRWGFVAFYVFVVLFTLLFGAALIPYVTLLIPVEAQVAAVLTINGIALVAVAVLQWKRPR